MLVGAAALAGCAGLQPGGAPEDLAVLYALLEPPHDEARLGLALAGFEARLVADPSEAQSAVLGARAALELALMARQSTNRGLQRGAARRGRKLALAADRLLPGAVEPPYYLAQLIGLDLEASALPSPRDIERLEKAARRAAEIDPGFDDAGPLRILGELYLEAPAWPLGPGDAEQAIEALERARSLVPGDAEIHWFLGRAYIRDENIWLGRLHLIRAERLGTSRPDIQAAARELLRKTKK